MQLGVAGAFFAVALVFVAFLVIGLIVAAIMGLATIMPAWLAALLVCAVFLLIAADRRADRASGSSRRPCRWFPRTPSAASSTTSASPRRARPSIPPCWTRTPPSTRPPRQPRSRRRQGQGGEGSQGGRRAGLRPPPTEPELRRRLDAAPRAPHRGPRRTRTRNSTSRPRPRPCWARPRHGCRRARKSSAASVARLAEDCGRRVGVRPARRGASATAQVLAGQLRQRWKPLARPRRVRRRPCVFCCANSSRARLPLNCRHQDRCRPRKGGPDEVHRRWFPAWAAPGRSRSGLHRPQCPDRGALHGRAAFHLARAWRRRNTATPRSCWPSWAAPTGWTATSPAGSTRRPTWAGSWTPSPTGWR